jgi:hypothetical protein
MKVQARFFVTAIEHAHVPAPGVFATVKLAPVYGEANRPWSAATPQGRIEMSITNPDAVEAFDLGKTYRVEFSPDLPPAPQKLRPDGIPRRCDLSLSTPAELAIRSAVEAVEAAGADPLLTQAVNTLHEARELVADYVDRDLPATA